MTGLAVESSELLHHLLLDRAVKVAIVVVALGVLALGMVVIWRRAGRGKDRDGSAGTGPRRRGVTVRRSTPRS
ncbi:hypothetical protein [Kitasatospora sp. NPDC051914]|uniref:hypothetical protein n=1 Tax=Kitasatospora sp. NPDC051914 TaxID=3154945 RepID=UPI0034305CD5